METGRTSRRIKMWDIAICKYLFTGEVMGAAEVTVEAVVVEAGDRHQLQPSTRFYCFVHFFPLLSRLMCKFWQECAI